MTTELDKISTLLDRNVLKGLANNNNHSFEEKIYLDYKLSCLVIEILIGGKERGVYGFTYIRENECVFSKLKYMYSDLINLYKEMKSKIPQDLKS